MGHKPWGMPERRARRHRAKQTWQGEVADELTLAEAQAFAEDQTRHHLGMSVAEFRQRAEAGTLPRVPVVPHLVALTGAKPTRPCC